MRLTDRALGMKLFAKAVHGAYQSQAADVASGTALSNEFGTARITVPDHCRLDDEALGKAVALVEAHGLTVTRTPR
ncbi:hypothetical protein ACFYVL_31470 [Streptomyces sp. NPDC004111]|uniref:hypothetical protein n=1 Tax=Streptomyces sp. NPDC004111 TaxID=3364690 RepID=UPI0036812BF5